MSEQVSSYQRILKSSSIIGGSSIIKILISLLRTKVLAVLLGPSGIGLSSLYSTLMATASTLAEMGLGTVGARQIAEAIGKKDDRTLAVARRALLFGTLFLAVFGGALVWLLRDILAEHVLGSTAESENVAWLGLGVALSVAGSSQGALIQGLRRIGDMARLNIYSTLLNTIFGIALLWYYGSQYLVFYVLIGPLIGFLVGYFYVLRLPKPEPTSIQLTEMVQQLRALFRLGIYFMGAGLAGTLVYLWIRVEILEQLGSEAVGQAQAVTAITSQYVGLVVGAMGADYYPRLTSVIHDKTAATRMVNEQTEIVLLLGAPVFIAMIGLAPWIIELLYSSAFTPAVAILRWQLLADVLKVVSWPLGFVILAVGDGKTFFFSEAITLLLLGGLIVLGMPYLGLQMTGIAFLASYVFYLPLVYLLARWRIGFVWTRTVVKLLSLIFFLCTEVAILSYYYWWGAYFAMLLSLLFALYTLGRLAQMVNLTGKVGGIGRLARVITKIIF